MPCPCCGALGITTFYRIDGIPVHDCRLMPSREEALAIPRGDLHLGTCDTCGFVFNTAFRIEDLDYAEDYEETQGFSPTFVAFADGLARTAIDRFDLRDKTILEIGCGKGEFLASLCGIGKNRGVGIDPSYVPGRLPKALARDLEFHREQFHPRHMACRPDFLCCRHTLEHLPQVQEFVSLVRDAIAGSPGPRDIPVTFDLPDTRRIWTEGAFWDVFYEHCSYFTTGTLASLFRRCGFEVTSLQREYGDQYLSLSACPANGNAVPRLGIETNLALDRAEALAFSETCRVKVDRFRGLLQQGHAAGERIVVWGGGSKGVSFLTTLGIDMEILAAVDINPFKQGKFMPGTGHPVVGPKDLLHLKPTQVLCMNPVYVEEIRMDLAALELFPQLIPCQ